MKHIVFAMVMLALGLFSVFIIQSIDPTTPIPKPYHDAVWHKTTITGNGTHHTILSLNKTLETEELDSKDSSILKEALDSREATIIIVPDKDAATRLFGLSKDKLEHRENEIVVWFIWEK